MNSDGFGHDSRSTGVIVCEAVDGRESLPAAKAVSVLPGEVNSGVVEAAGLPFCSKFGDAFGCTRRKVGVWAAMWHMWLNGSKERLEQVLKRVDSTTRRVFVMRYIEKKSFASIAKSLGKDVGEVWALCYRAFHHVQCLMKQTD